jgi:flagellar biosynthetic protein FliR
MEIPFNALIAWVNGYLWPFARIGAMLSVAPVFGARIFPARVRLSIAVALTLSVQPVVGTTPMFDALSVKSLVIMLHQILIGIWMGMVLQVGFAALIVAGQITAMSMGLGFASVVDPQNGVQVPIVSQFYLTIGTLLFFALEGHLVLIEIVARSFSLLPVGESGLSPDALFSLASWSALMFADGLRIALPVLSVVLLTNMAFGVATRAAPQLNLFAVGFATTIFIGFGAMWLTLTYSGPVFERALTASFQMIEAIL